VSDENGPRFPIKCCRCGMTYDKGVPPTPGQDDSAFICEECEQEINAAELAKAAPTVSLKG
jgi:hypothetical protein